MAIAVIGEALMDFIADGDGAYRPHLGGSPFNVAIGLARQGADVSYLCPFSDDVFGEQLRNAMIAEGVSLPLKRRSRFPTSLAMVSLNDAGLPAYRLYRQGVADKDTTADELIDSLPSQLSILHTGSLAITPSQLTKIREVFKQVRAAGGTISIDLNLRLGASADTDAYRDGVRSLVPLADVVKASDEDLDALGLRSGARRNAETLIEEMNGGLFLLTEGDGGAVLYSQHGIVERAAYRVEQLADTVGAGDTFHAAFLAALDRGSLSPRNGNPSKLDQLADALNLACAAAAINVTRVGCSPPTLEETRLFIDESRGAL